MKMSMSRKIRKNEEKGNLQEQETIFQQLQDYQQNHLLVSTTEQNSSFLVETIRTCNRKTGVAVQASGDAIVCPMVNLVVTIRPRLTTTSSPWHEPDKQHPVSCYTLSHHTT